jgi:CSLREA domain-containing protein
MVRRVTGASVALILALALIALILVPSSGDASHTTFIVNTTGDDQDASPGDGTCATGGGVCSLRAAIQEANAHAGADSINFTFTPILVGQTGNGPLPVITEKVTINGNTGGLTRVELIGTQAGGNYGLSINAPDSTVSSVVINGFGAGGVNFADGSDGSTLRNSFIGTDSSGTTDLGNGDNSGFFYEAGVVIHGSEITIGGTSATDGNVISGNSVGVLLTPFSSDTTIAGNYIGTDVSGTADLGNSGPGILVLSADDTIIGGASAGARNIISGNVSGIRLDLEGVNISERTIITGNYIGTDVSGSVGLGNSSNGVRIQGADATTIGGASAGTRNVISGNGNSGVYLDTSAGGTPDLTTIAGNYIGTNASGTGSIWNAAGGIELGGAQNSCVGGIIVGSVCTPTSGAGNVISGNIGSGITASVLGSSGAIIGNYIGTNAAGTAILGNTGSGIDAVRLSGSTIGGTTALARNVISGNGQHGIRGDRSVGGPNDIIGNYIGLNAAGTQAIGNGLDGIHIEGLPECVGGVWNGSVCNPVAGGGNVISGNASDGIEFVGTNDSWVLGNLIGINASQTVGLGNGGHGVYINGSIDMTIGGGASGGNTIFANGLDGVRVSGSGAGGNSIRGNSIWANGGKGIETINGGNNEPVHAPPVITAGGFSGAGGSACSSCTVDIYSDNTENEGRVYHGSVQADGGGNWSFTGSITGPKLTATATNASGTTEFASFVGNPQVGPEFTVNSTGPEDDGVCSDAFGDCTIREGMDAAIAFGPGGTVHLGDAQTYTLNAVDNAGNGLPLITSEVAVFGNGSTIARDPGAPLFRIFQVPAGGILLLDNVTVSGGEATGATGDGGGIFVNGGQLHLFNSTVSGNRAAIGTTGTNGGPGRHGGGIAISGGGSAFINTSAISGNNAGIGGAGTELNGGNGGNGGGIALLGGTLNLERSLVSVNFAGTGRFSGTGSGGTGGWGGGLYLAGGSSATISNTTLRTNAAGGGAVGTTGNGNGGNGGGIAAPSAIVTLTNLTFSDNNVGAAGGPNAANGTGSGLHGDGNAITVRNTIMANGAGGNCGTGSVPQLGSTNNISVPNTDASCGGSFALRTLAQINFGTFGNHGGPTSTVPLIAPSVAIDAGNNSHCENPPVGNSDQRGFPRPFDGDNNSTATCDVGAYEYCLDGDADGPCDSFDNCPAMANANQADGDLDGSGDACDNCPTVANFGQENTDGDAYGNACDNCPSTPSADQADFDADGLGNVCDSEDDGDGYSDVIESGVPLCLNNINDDGSPVSDDTLPNDGCPAVGSAEANCINNLDDDADTFVNDGCGAAGSHSEAQFKIGTGSVDPCGQTGWPSDVFSSGPSANKLTIQDVISYITAPRKLDKNPGETGFDSRWDLVPGRGILGKFININDLTALVNGTTGNPPMFNNTRAFDKVCPFAP